MELQPGQNADAVAESEGFENMGRIGSLANFYRFRALSNGPHAARSVHDRSARLQSKDGVVFVEKQAARQQEKKAAAPINPRA